MKLHVVLIVSEFNCNPFKSNEILELQMPEEFNLNNLSDYIVKKVKDAGFEKDEIFAVIHGEDITNQFNL